MDSMMIKEAAKYLGVEAHVLRYWEDELGLTIKRNSMGHRYYDERDVMLFNKVKELKENGLSLKDIKLAIVKQRREREGSEPVVEKTVQDEESLAEIKIVDFKQAQIQTLMNKVVANAFRENKGIITDSIKEEITSDVMRQFDTVMREKEEKEEARFKKLDEYLRQLQLANKEVAATKSRRLFGRKK